MHHLLLVVLVFSLLGGCSKQDEAATPSLPLEGPAEVETTPGVPPGPIPPGTVIGQLLWDAAPLSERTDATLSLWIRDENRMKVATPRTTANGDRFELSGLEPGRYLVVATVNANTDNGLGHPGDFYGSKTVELDAEEGLRVSIDIPEMIHLVRPQDNDKGVEGWDTECAAKRQLGIPTDFAWKPLAGEVDYRYAIYPGAGGAAVAEGVSSEPQIALELPVNAPGECYRLQLSAYRDGRRIGALMTHGTHGGRAGFYGFRVGDLPAERAVSPRFDGSTPAERWEEPLIALSFDEGFDGPGLQLAAEPETYRWVDGPRTRALWLQGGLEWAEDPPIELPGTYTLSLLIRPDELAEGSSTSILRTGLMHLDQRDQRQHLAVLFEGGGHRSFSLNAKSGWIEAGAWHHLVVVKNIGISVWIDGVQARVSSSEGKDSMRLQSLRLGSRQHDRQGWSGAFDELRIWDRALTQEEILTLVAELGITRRAADE